MVKGGIITSSPGKIILFGEHAVVYGQLAIAASIDLRTYSYITLEKSKAVTLEFNDVDVSLKIPLQELPLNQISNLFEGSLTEINVDSINKINYSPPALEPYLLNLLKEYNLTNHNGKGAVVAALATYALINVLLKDVIQPNQGFNLKIISKIPVGAGLGSSASFSVSMTSSLLKLFLPQFDSLSNLVKLQLINRLSYLAEKVLHGNPSGVDNTVATFGNLVAYKTGNFTRLVNLNELTVLITDTKVPKNTKLLVAGVRALRDKFPEIINPIIESIGHISSRFQMSLQSSGSAESDPLLLMKDLVALNQNLLRTLGVSHPSIEQVVDITSQFQLNTKLTGAGGGGCCLTLVPASQLDHVNQVKEELEKLGFQCHVTKLTDQGVTYHQAADPQLPDGLIPSLHLNKL